MVNWLTPLLNLGKQRPLEFDDLLELEPKTSTIRNKLENEWNNNKRKENRLLKCLWSTFKNQFLMAILPRLTYAIVEIFIPYLIKMVISYVQNKDESIWNALFIILGIIIIPTLRTISLQTFWFRTVRKSQKKKITPKKIY